MFNGNLYQRQGLSGELKQRKIMLSSKLKALSVVLAVTFSSLASAELVERDYLTQGDGHISYDTQTGLEWLDFSYTKGMSIYNYLQNPVSDFRVANYDELTTMFNNALGFPEGTSEKFNYMGKSSEDAVLMNNFIDTFGNHDYSNAGVLEYFYGRYYVEIDGHQTSGLGGVVQRMRDGSVTEQYYTVSQGQGSSLGYRNNSQGLFLVRGTPQEYNPEQGGSSGDINNGGSNNLEEASNVSVSTGVGALLGLSVMGAGFRRKNK